ncbi:MAG: hypothetical protein V1799_11730 [bacterium]
MNCYQFQQLLHLNRPGERNERETIELREHLAACKRCSLEQQQIDNVGPMLETLGSLMPVHEHAEQLTAEIMRRVRAVEAPARENNLTDRLFDFFLRPAVRFATMALSFAAIGIFTFQCLNVLSDIRVLESTVNQATQATASSEISYSVDSEHIQELAQSPVLHQFIPPGRSTAAKGRISISQRDIAMILSSSGFRSLTTTTASSMIQVDKDRLDNILKDVINNATNIIHLAQ